MIVNGVHFCHHNSYPSFIFFFAFPSLLLLPSFSSCLSHQLSPLHSCQYILPPSPNPYSIIPYSPLSFLTLCFSYFIFLSLCLWLPLELRSKQPSIPALPVVQCQILLSALLLLLSLSGLFPQLEVNTLQDGIISFLAL